MRIHIASGITDMRRSCRCAGMIKLLFHDGNGVCLFAKRLNQGAFTYPRDLAARGRHAGSWWIARRRHINGFAVSKTLLRTTYIRTYIHTNNRIPGGVGDRLVRSSYPEMTPRPRLSDIPKRKHLNMTITKAMRRSPLLLLAASAACTQMSTNDAIVPLQAATAQLIGLASSDELTVSNVNNPAPDALGGQQISYTATTARGRVFSCAAVLTPGLLTTPPKVSNPHCVPVLVHQ